MLIVLLAVSTLASAATYSTSIVTSYAGQSSMGCVVSNVGTTPIDLTVTFFDVTGASVAPVYNGCGSSVAAGASCLVLLDGTVTQFARCSVNASSSKIRAALILDNSAATLLSVPATRK
jgi:hypothetical protein